MTDIDYDELAARPGTVAVIDVRTMAEHSGEAGYPWSALRTGATRRHEWSRLAEE
jgi:hypothetical protein